MPRVRELIISIFVCIPALAACSNANLSQPTQPVVEDRTPEATEGEQPATETREPTRTAVPGPDPSPSPSEASPTGIPTPDLPETGETINPGWSVRSIDLGIKPAIDLDEDNQPHITYMVESEHGFLKYATIQGGTLSTTTVAEGYFYGPPAIVVDLQGRPQIVYHDHQDTNFVPEKGDAARAVGRDGEWFNAPISHPGHDGWDNSIAVDANDTVHTASIDPSQFGSLDGVEYAYYDGNWHVEVIGSGPVPYEFGTSIDVDLDNRPAITYYDELNDSLQYAQRDSDGQWTITELASGGAGKFSSLAFDMTGNPHISYFVEESESSGSIAYAYWDGESWQSETVAQVENVKQGPVGARHLTWIRMDREGRAHIAYNDQSILAYAVRENDGWVLAEIARAGEFPFGQLVVFALDSADQPHLVYSVFLNPAIPQGVVRYATLAASP